METPSGSTFWATKSTMTTQSNRLLLTPAPAFGVNTNKRFVKLGGAFSRRGGETDSGAERIPPPQAQRHRASANQAKGCVEPQAQRLTSQ